jgi:hypothetical protein
MWRSLFLADNAFLKSILFKLKTALVDRDSWLKAEIIKGG